MASMTQADGQLPVGGFNPLVPEFDVFDLAQSLRFWCQGLGFDIAYEREGFAYLEREGAQVMLSRMNGNWMTGPLDAPLGRGINFQFTVAAIMPMLEGLRKLNWPLFREPHEMWYQTGGYESGDFQFLVQDPSGYLLRFSESLGQRPTTVRPDSGT